jgi:hypothetical protein
MPVRELALSKQRITTPSPNMYHELLLRISYKHSDTFIKKGQLFKYLRAKGRFHRARRAGRRTLLFFLKIAQRMPRITVTVQKIQFIGCHFGTKSLGSLKRYLAYRIFT